MFSIFSLKLISYYKFIVEFKLKIKFNESFTNLIFFK